MATERQDHIGRITAKDTTAEPVEDIPTVTPDLIAKLEQALAVKEQDFWAAGLPTSQDGLVKLASMYSAIAQMKVVISVLSGYMKGPSA